MGEKVLTAAGLLQGSSVVGDVAGSVTVATVLMTMIGLIRSAMAQKTS